MFEKIKLINVGLSRAFPNGNTPYQIMTRLLEECGELAQQVNHFEDNGVKRKKYGEPDRAKFAKEIQDVLRATLQIVDYYNLEKELNESIATSLGNLKRDGWLEEG